MTASVNRKITVPAASLGGYSARQLPANLDYTVNTIELIDEYILIRPDGGVADGKIQADSQGFPSFVSLVEGTATYSSNGGPGGAPALQALPDNNVVRLTGRYPFEGAVTKYTSKPITDFTLQLYVRLGDTYVRGQREMGMYLDINAASGKRVGLYVQFVTTGSNTTGTADVELAFYQRGVSTSVIYEREGRISTQPSPAFNPGTWHHMLLSRGGSTLYAFLDGQLLASQASILGDFTIGQTPISNWLDLQFGQYQERVAGGQTVAIHGFRFDDQCLHTSSFTPPTNL
jgi:hypothetical protein